MMRSSISTIARQIAIRTKRIAVNSNNNNNNILYHGKLFVKSRLRTAALVDPSEAKCSYVDRLSFIFPLKAWLSEPTHLVLVKDFNINPSLF